MNAHEQSVLNVLAENGNYCTRSTIPKRNTGGTTNS